MYSESGRKSDFYYTFDGLKTTALVRFAAGYQADLSIAMNPSKYQKHGRAIAPESNCVAATINGRVSLNYAYAAMHGLQAAEISAMEALIDEADSRLELNGGRALSGLKVFNDLAKAVDSYLSFMQPKHAYSVDDLLRLSDEMIEEYSLQPV